QYSNVSTAPTSPGATAVPILVCPADIGLNKNPVVGFNNFYWGMTSYGGNAGSRNTFWTAVTRDGVFHVNSKVKIADIMDGTSNTFLFTERFHFDKNWTTAYGLDINTYGGWAWTNGFAGEDQMLSCPWNRTTDTPWDANLSGKIINWMLPN